MILNINRPMNLRRYNTAFTEDIACTRGHFRRHGTRVQSEYIMMSLRKIKGLAFGQLQACCSRKLDHFTCIDQRAVPGSARERGGLP